MGRGRANVRRQGGLSRGFLVLTRQLIRRGQPRVGNAAVVVRRAAIGLQADGLVVVEQRQVIAMMIVTLAQVPLLRRLWEPVY